MIIKKKIDINKMMSYNGINVLLDCCAKLFNNVKTKIFECKIKILEYKNKLIQIKNNYIEKMTETKYSIYNRYLAIKDRTKTNYYNYKEKFIMKYNKYWRNNYDKIK